MEWRYNFWINLCLLFKCNKVQTLKLTIQLQLFMHNAYDVYAFQSRMRYVSWQLNNVCRQHIRYKYCTIERNALRFFIFILINWLAIISCRNAIPLLQQTLYDRYYVQSPSNAYSQTLCIWDARIMLWDVWCDGCTHHSHCMGYGGVKYCK